MTYYNTNRETGETLKKSRQKADSQEDKIYKFMLKWSRFRWSPEGIWDECFNRSVPLTSIRRALSNLTWEGKIRKCDKMVEGLYGKKVHTWQATVPEGKQLKIL